MSGSALTVTGFPSTANLNVAMETPVGRPSRKAIGMCRVSLDPGIRAGNAGGARPEEPAECRPSPRGPPHADAFSGWGLQLPVVTRLRRVAATAERRDGRQRQRQVESLPGPAPARRDRARARHPDAGPRRRSSLDPLGGAGNVLARSAAG